MFNRFRTLLLATTALVPLGLVPAFASPLGAQVVGGSASVQGQGTATVTVTQTTNSAIINWNTFNIGAGEKTNIVMPSSSSVQLDRVTGGLGPSQIFGSLWSNGRVFLVNPDGMLVGSGAKINTGSFLATTHDIANADFMAGRYNFTIPGNPSASIVNQGTITAQNGGFAALVAPGVRNTGTITANLGTVALASGNGFTLDFYGDKLITLGLSDSVAAQVKDVSTGQTLSSLVSNEGKLKANGGTVQLTAVAARTVVDSVINNTGVIEANSIGTRNGMIVLSAATAATKPAGAPVQTVKVSGTLSAAGKRKGTTGGTVQVTGEAITLAGETIDASGRAGGGTVLIGGDTGGGNVNSVAAGLARAQLQAWQVPTATTVSVDSASTINASAKDTGDGGKVVVWSDVSTVFNGSISARGGAQSGDGGFVETSSHQQLAFNGTVDLSAANGQRGTLLLDPQDITIGSTGTWVITPTSLQTALAGGDVLIGTNASLSGSGDVTFAQSVSWASASKLIIGAYRNIVINDGVTLKNTGAGELDLTAGVTLTGNNGSWGGTGVGTIIFNGSGIVDFSQSTGLVNFGYNPVGGYANPTNFTSSVLTKPLFLTQQFNAFMWVNNVTDLQNINQNLSGKYIIANKIDASATASWNGGAGFIPIGTGSTPFTGLLYGEGGNVPFVTAGAVIDKLTINSSASSVGLFGYIGSGAFIRGVGLTNETVVGGSSGATGGLVGWNVSGIIFNSYTTGSIGSAATCCYVGGLVGINQGTIYQSYSTASVQGTGSSGTGGFVGGLVGVNGPTTGTISQSYATGTVTNTNTGSYISSMGGLVGTNASSILQSYATGAVVDIRTTANAITEIGSLVGSNTNTINQSYAIGSVTIPNSFAGAVWVGGLIGSLQSGSATNSYWDTQATGQATSAAGAGLTTAQLKSGLPTGFDPTVWATSGSVNSGYPYLQWQIASSTTTINPLTGSGLNSLSTTSASSASAQYFNINYINNLVLPSTTQTVVSTPLPIISTNDTVPNYTAVPTPVSTPASTASPQYTFQLTSSGTVEVWENGSLIATVSTAYATQQYGYKPSGTSAPAVSASPAAAPIISGNVTTPSGAVVNAATGQLVSPPPAPTAAPALPANSLTNELAAVNTAMNATGTTHIQDASLLVNIVSTLGLNKSYSKDGAGYIYPSNYGTAYRQECVALVLALKPSLPTNTNNWTKGSLQVDLNGQPNPSLQPGTAIATFNPNGSYPASGVLSDGTIAHTAIFLGYGNRNGQFGMYILDQYTAHPGIPAQAAEIRFDALTPAKANLYFSITAK